MTFDFAGAQSALEDLNNELQLIHDQIDDKITEQIELNSKRLPKADAQQRVFDFIDLEAEKYRDELAKELMSATTTRTKNFSFKPFVETISPGNYKVSESALFYFFNSAIKTAVSNTFDTMEYEQPEGLPKAEREQASLKIDQDVDGLEKRKFLLYKTAEKAGLKITESTEEI